MFLDQMSPKLLDSAVVYLRSYYIDIMGGIYKYYLIKVGHLSIHFRAIIGKYLVSINCLTSVKII